jgi:predicted neuraminidase
MKSVLIPWIIALTAASLNLFAQEAQFIADQMPTPSCHASTIVETRSGALLAAWFGGTAEGRPDVAIWGSRKEKGGSWSAPAELVRETNIATFNPVLFHTGDGLLWLYYKFGPHPTGWTAGRRFSKDQGRTWSAIDHLPAGLWGPIRSKPLVMPDGLIVSGTSSESYHSWAAWIERSSDHGATWTKHGPITVPMPAPSQSTASRAGDSDPFAWERTHGIIQPVVIHMGGKRLRLFARATNNIGKVCVADSSDLGITWTAARPIDVPNPNSGVDVVRLKDGRLVMIYNHTARGRSPLNLGVSADGERWNMFHTLEPEPGEYSYPAIVQGSDGSLHMTYTWKRQKIKYVRVGLDKVPPAPAK